MMSELTGNYQRKYKDVQRIPSAIIMPQLLLMCIATQLYRPQPLSCVGKSSQPVSLAVKAWPLTHGVNTRT